MVALRVKAEIDLAVGSDVAHKALASLADCQGRGELAAVEKPEAGIVNDRVVTEGRFAGDEERDFVADLEGSRGVVEVALQARGGDDAFGLVVDKNTYDHGFADLHATVLFGVGKEQILSQAPVEKGPHTRVDFLHFQCGEVADGGEWFARCRDETILGIPIDEYLQHIAGSCTFGNGIARQEDFAEFPAIEEKPGAGVFEDSEAIEFSEKRHGEVLSFRN